MGWNELLAWVAGKIDQELQAKLQYVVAENRILRSQMSGQLRLTGPQRLTLPTLGIKLGGEALESLASIVTPETILNR